MGLWKKMVIFHGHPCCVLATGYRAALLALDKLGPLKADKHMDVFLKTADCSDDPLQVLLNCTVN